MTWCSSYETLWNTNFRIFSISCSFVVASWSVLASRRCEWLTPRWADVNWNASTSTRIEWSAKGVWIARWLWNCNARHWNTATARHPEVELNWDLKAVDQLKAEMRLKIFFLKLSKITEIKKKIFTLKIEWFNARIPIITRCFARTSINAPTWWFSSFWSMWNSAKWLFVAFHDVASSAGRLRWSDLWNETAIAGIWRHFYLKMLKTFFFTFLFHWKNFESDKNLNFKVDCDVLIVGDIKLQFFCKKIISISFFKIKIEWETYCLARRIKTRILKVHWWADFHCKLVKWRGLYRKACKDRRRDLGRAWLYTSNQLHKRSCMARMVHRHKCTPFLISLWILRRNWWERKLWFCKC